jgi:phospholipid transport system substrate-binding protein
MGKLFSNFSAVLAAALLTFAPAGLRAETPRETVRSSNQKVLDIYASHENVDEEAERKIYDVIDGVTDFAGISDSVTSRFCRKLTAGECEEFNRVFTRLLRLSSIKKLGRYRADGFEYLGEEIEGQSAVVRTIALYGEEKIYLDYSLEERNGSWRIVNYVVDDVDTIRNYRKQFTNLFSKKSFEEVIERLEKKISSYEGEEGP